MRTKHKNPPTPHHISNWTNVALDKPSKPQQKEQRTQSFMQNKLVGRINF